MSVGFRCVTILPNKFTPAGRPKSRAPLPFLQGTFPLLFKKRYSLRFGKPIALILLYQKHQPSLSVKIKILIADDHTLFRQGVAKALAQDPQIEIVGEAENGAHLLQLLANVQPHVILLDIQMPELDGLQAAGVVRKKYPHVGLLMVSMHNDAAHIRAAWQLGVGGYLLKTAEVSEVASAIKTVHDGSRYYGGGAAQVLDGLLNPVLARDGRKERETLTLCEKDKQILILLANGLAYGEVARNVHLAEKTVEHHVERMKFRTETRTIGHLVAHCLIHNLITKDDLKESEEKA